MFAGLFAGLFWVQQVWNKTRGVFCFLATITVITKAPDLWHETYSYDSYDTNSRRPLGISWDFNGFHMFLLGLVWWLNDPNIWQWQPWIRLYRENMSVKQWALWLEEDFSIEVCLGESINSLLSMRWLPQDFVPKLGSNRLPICTVCHLSQPLRPSFGESIAFPQLGDGWWSSATAQAEGTTKTLQKRLIKNSSTNIN